MPNSKLKFKRAKLWVLWAVSIWLLTNSYFLSMRYAAQVPQSGALHAHSGHSLQLASDPDVQLERLIKLQTGDPQIASQRMNLLGASFEHNLEFNYAEGIFLHALNCDVTSDASAKTVLAKPVRQCIDLNNLLVAEALLAESTSVAADRRVHFERAQKFARECKEQLQALTPDALAVIPHLADVSKANEAALELQLRFDR